MASVTKRVWVYQGITKSAWAVRYVDGGSRQRQRTFAKKKDADTYRSRLETELGDRTHLAQSQTVTVAAAMDQWLRDCDRRHKIGDRMAGYTRNNYQKTARIHVIPAFSKIKFTELTANQVQDFINEKIEEYSWRTVTSMICVLRLMLKHAIWGGWLRRNPLADRAIRIPRNGAPQIPIPTKDELRRLLCVLATKWPLEHRRAYAARVVMVVLAVFAGSRRGEIIGLQWENVDFEAGTIKVRYSYSSVDGLRAPKTQAGVRTIPMALPVRAALSQLRDAVGNEAVGYVLTGTHGKPIIPQHLTSHYWKRMSKAADLLNENGSPKYHFHALRHAAASLLIEQGLPPLHVKKIIGHSSVTMTLDVYGHLFPEDDASRHAVREVASQFDVVWADLPALLAPKARVCRRHLRQTLKCQSARCTRFAQHLLRY
jgi:integrase